jgi:putative ABC transport system permease protein
VNTLLKTGGRTNAGPERGRLRGLLIVAQIAVSLVLLIVGGLFVKALQRARNVDLGFRSDHILVADVDLRRSTYTAEKRVTYYRNAIERVTSLPGVRAAAWTSALPFGFGIGQTPLQADGEPVPAQGQEPLSFTVSVTPEYFAAAHVALVAGRTFDDRDGAKATPVVIVNQTLARQLWPDRDPLGRRVRLAHADTMAEVIGVVKDGKYILLWEAPRPMLFQPIAQDAPSQATLEVVTAGSPHDIASAVRTSLQAIDPDVPAYRVQSMDDYLEYGGAFLLFRVGALLTGAFGVLGLILSSIGLYGVVAFDVTQRTHEIGVRMALGAPRRGILRDVILRAAWLAGSGAVLGVAIAAGLTRTLRPMLLGVSPLDPIIYGRTALLLMAVCLVAALVPARRAAAASPLDALRAD